MSFIPFTEKNKEEKNRNLLRNWTRVRIRYPGSGSGSALKWSGSVTLKTHWFYSYYLFAGFPVDALPWRWNRVGNGNPAHLQDEGGVSRPYHELLLRRPFAQGTNCFILLSLSLQHFSSLCTLKFAFYPFVHFGLRIDVVILFFPLALPL